MTEPRQPDHRPQPPQQATLWDWHGPSTEEARFAAFDAANPEIWRLFVLFTFDRIRRSCSHYSARGVFHRIRWETVADTDDPEFKVNDRWSPYYARKFHRAYPQHGGFFRTRRAKADNPGAMR
jgi:hypothetical protein